MSSVRDRIMVITDLLLGAVYADDNLKGAEEDAVRRLLSDLLGDESLPDEVDARIKTFPAHSFDLNAATKDFAKDPPIQKRRLLELVAAVHDADEEIDLAEDDYLRKVAEALDVPRNEYADLALDYEVEELRSSLATLRKPPPVPTT